MTDRITALTVVLEVPTRDDDVESILGAIRQIRGVLSVVPIVQTAETYAAYERARHDLSLRVVDVLQKVRDAT